MEGAEYTSLPMQAKDTGLPAKTSLWDRKWLHYRIAAVLPGDPDSPGDDSGMPSSDDSSTDSRQGWSGYIIELPAPILALDDIVHVIELESARIYPPFKLNRQSAHTGLLSDVDIPVGIRELDKRVPIPEYAVKGLTINMQSDNRGEQLSGLRFDCKSGTNLDSLVATFLSTVRLYTHQWWVSSSRSPFDAGIRMSFDLDRNFAPIELPAARGREPAEAQWFGHAATQRFIGVEKILDADLWKNIGHHLALELPAENGLAFFFDAVNDYMGFQDNDCIMHLALAYEVCENKARIMNGQSPRSKNKQLLNDPILAKGDLGAVFRRIITDRDNIAHGRSPYFLAKEPQLIECYLSAGLELAQIYLTRCSEYGWREALQLSVSRKAK